MFILVKASFLKGIQQSRLITKKTSKRSKTGIWIKLRKNLVILQVPYGLGTKFIKNTCERSH